MLDLFQRNASFQIGEDDARVHTRRVRENISSYKKNKWRKASTDETL